MEPRNSASPDGQVQRGKTLKRPEALVRVLGTAITSGRYRPGETLPNEIELSRQLEVSRSALREAIHTLSAKGLVEARPRTGTRILPPSRWSLLDRDVLDWCLSGTPDPDLLRAVDEFRLTLEPEMAALAAQRRSPADLTAMRESLMRMERGAMGSADRGQAAQDFHAALLAATGNAVMAGLHSLASQMDPSQDYWPLFDAIAAGGPDAARSAMAELIRPAQ
ncbi:FadR/GntR family transcriptional regulator [Maricaulis parjimensis]|uniref:FadR/GntR family transcriptional regulator n=1 Tax=Maricaulis parjimensis TaxID=144023 RepID=UPI001939BB24|nr:FadR/GntR family transcriptional regulator [Maricaulis parjimensis]